MLSQQLQILMVRVWGTWDNKEIPKYQEATNDWMYIMYITYNLVRKKRKKSKELGAWTKASIVPVHKGNGNTNECSS